MSVFFLRPGLPSRTERREICNKWILLSAKRRWKQNSSLFSTSWLRLRILGSQCPMNWPLSSERLQFDCHKRLSECGAIFHGVDKDERFDSWSHGIKIKFVFLKSNLLLKCRLRCLYWHSIEDAKENLESFPCSSVKPTHYTITLDGDKSIVCLLSFRP